MLVYNSSWPLSHIIVFGMMNNLRYKYLTYSRSVSNDSCLCQILVFIFISWFTWTIQTSHTVLSELKNLRQGALNAVDTVLFIKTDLYRTGPRSLLNRFRLHWNETISSGANNCPRIASPLGFAPIRLDGIKHSLHGFYARVRSISLWGVWIKKENKTSLESWKRRNWNKQVFL